MEDENVSVELFSIIFHGPQSMSRLGNLTAILELALLPELCVSWQNIIGMVGKLLSFGTLRDEPTCKQLDNRYRHIRREDIFEETPLDENCNLENWELQSTCSSVIPSSVMQLMHCRLFRFYETETYWKRRYIWRNTLSRDIGVAINAQFFDNTFNNMRNRVLLHFSNEKISVWCDYDRNGRLWTKRKQIWCRRKYFGKLNWEESWNEKKVE